jgi:FkbM family methyltransferase
VKAALTRRRGCCEIPRAAALTESTAPKPSKTAAFAPPTCARALPTPRRVGNHIVEAICDGDAMNFKAFARFCYATFPGVAPIRFGLMDLTAKYLVKPEFMGLRWISPVGTGLIIDIGANRGQSVAALKRFAPRSRIVAFEPDPRSFQVLLNRYRDDSTVTIHNFALGDKSEVITFYCPTYGRWACEGMGATTRQAATEWLSDPNRMFCYDHRKLKVAECQVVCRTLDSFNLAPTVIKLHAQAAEVSILRGARQTIDQHKPALMCAFPSVDVIDLCRDMGFNPYAYRNGTLVQDAISPPERTFTWFLMEKHVSPC